MADEKPLDYEAIKGLCTLAVRMRRAQIEVERSREYSASSYARKMALQEHFDQHARELLGWEGEVRQPAEVYSDRSKR